MKNNIVLTGIMGAGKTTVGKALADILTDYVFIDADDVITQKEGMSISDIFEQKSEDYFRKLEKEVLKELSEKEGIILALGGGAFENEENRTNLKKNGHVFYLKGSVDELFNRIKNETGRPMLKDKNPKNKLADLLKIREPNYLKADFIIDTDFKKINEIAEEIKQMVLKKLKPKEEILSINIPPTNGKSYNIYINNDNFSDLKKILDNETLGKKRLVVFSEKVYKLYGKFLKFNKSETYVLKDGEKYKNIKSYEKIIKKMIDLKMSRKDILIAIGGGVIGDMVGFAAATYMRGIDFIQVPTTLLACVDSSVGGKTAIDMPNGKNYAGAFYQPKAVYINTNFLKTLDEKQYKSGFGEVIKYAFIEKSCGAETYYDLLTCFEANRGKYINRDMDFLTEVIKMCLELKSAVVSHDEKEKGLRKILNLGHTFGHALEEETKYKRYTHGFAVVQGLMYIFNYALQNGLCSRKYYDEAFTLMNIYGFEPDSFLFVNRKHTIEYMFSDKKADSNGVTLIVPTKEGEVTTELVNDPKKLNFDAKYKQHD